MVRKILITGGAGFVGHHVIDAIIKYTDWKITFIDRLDCSGNLNRLAELNISKDRVKFVYHDLKAPFNDQLIGQIRYHDYIVHMAAATHVDRSIDDPLSFVMDNVVATCNLLNFARIMECEKFINFSTDEVFGPAPPGVKYKENDRYNSGNPYAATKAGAEELGMAFYNTYKVPVITTHTMNVYGERQHPEKYIPSTINKVFQGETVTIHANKDRTKAGSRFYIHASNVANAILFLLKHGNPGEKYNIVGEKEVDNLALAQLIAGVINKPLKYELVDFHSSRPGHDLRYALCGEKMRSLGWAPPDTLEQGITKIVNWTLANPHWLITR
jgi:dTDP-glucose 4,6-dehydratase